MSIRKTSVHEFQQQIKDVRSQLFDQVKCLEHRTDTQLSILHEVNDFLKKRSEIDLEYSKQLDKLVKSVMLKYKNEKQKRTNWPLYSTCNLWQQLVDDTKEEAKQRGITAEVYGNHISSSIASRSVSFQKISKKCREISVLAQGEIMRVLNELQTAMKTYQLCYAEFSIVSNKLQQFEAFKNKNSESSSRKQKSIQKNFNKKSEKFESARLKCNRARNEYLLCIDAANAALHKFFADDLSDLIDCSDLGMEHWLNLILTNIIAVRKAVCQTEMNSLANLGSFRESLQSRVDKQKFFESNSSTFMLPKRFEYKCDSSESIDSISLGEGMSDELKQRHHQIKKRLTTLHAESEASLSTLEETEQRIKDILDSLTMIEITGYGIADHRPPSDTLESELNKAHDNFSFYLFNANLIMRLEARANGISKALLENDVYHQTNSNISKENESREILVEQSDWYDLTRRKKRIGSQASTNNGTENSSISAINNQAQASPRRRRARLFGGCLEEYVEATGETIPLVVISCIRVLSQYALHHQGVFRVSGSQAEINNIKEAFENDPLSDVHDSSDANSISGVLKLYLRELREPLFPFYLFERITDCAKSTSTEDFINQITPLLNKLPRSTYLLLRYLFAFLNHLSEFSDENMMCFSNLAICFGPTLLPIPDGKDQVFYQNYVNEVIKNLIIHCDSIFTAKISGPRYQKYDHANATMTTTTTENNREIELFMDDNESYNAISEELPMNLESLTNDSANFKLIQRDYEVPKEILLNKGFKNSSNFNNSMTISNVSSNNYDSTIKQSVYNTTKDFTERLPPAVTATLLKSGIHDNINCSVKNTYCYSSSEENGSNTNLSNFNNSKPNTLTPAELEQQLTFNEPSLLKTYPISKREDNVNLNLSVADNTHSKVINSTDYFGNNRNETQQPQKISTSTTTNSRNLPISNLHAIQAVSVNATNSAESNDNYASILGKAERIRIPMLPHSTTISNAVHPTKMTCNSQNDSHLQTAIKTIDVLVGAPPSYNLLYGGQKSKPSPTVSSPSSAQSTTIQGDSENVPFRVVSRSSSSMSTAQQNSNNGADIKSNTPSNSSPTRRPKTTEAEGLVQPDLVSNVPPQVSQQNMMFSKSSLY